MLRNIETTYGSVTKFLHWLMAAWIVTAYVVIDQSDKVTGRH